MCSGTMYVRCEVLSERQFIEIDNVDKLTFKEFTKAGM